MLSTVSNSSFLSEALLDWADRTEWQRAEAPKPAVSGIGVNHGCGDKVTMWQKEGKWFWSGDGCTVCRAGANYLCSSLLGQEIDSGSFISKLESEIGFQLTPHRINCALTALLAWQNYGVAG